MHPYVIILIMFSILYFRLCDGTFEPRHFAAFQHRSQPRENFVPLGYATSGPLFGILSRIRTWHARAYLCKPFVGITISLPINMSTRRLQLTLAILKPDLAQRPYSVEHVRSMLIQNNFIAIRSKEEHLSPSKAQDFYREHEGKFFYNRLVTFMSSGHSHIHILARLDDAISTWRTLMGPTKVPYWHYRMTVV